MDYIPHLEELRKRIFICLGVFLAASLTAYFFSKQLLEIFTWPLRLYHSESLVFQKPYEAFLIHLKVAAFTGFVASLPVTLTQLWLFITPGLYKKEKQVFLSVAAISICLFWIGVLFSYFLVIPWGLRFMLEFQTPSLVPMLSAGPYFSFVIGMMLAFGVLFDFPVILVGLVELNVLHTSWLAQSRRAVIVMIFIAAAILTPSPDPLSQLLLAVPLWLLFEISLWIAAYREARKPPSLR